MACVPNPRPLLLVRKRHMGLPTRELKIAPYSSRLRVKQAIRVPAVLDGRGKEAQLVPQEHWSVDGLLVAYSPAFFPCSPETGHYRPTRYLDHCECCGL